MNKICFGCGSKLQSEDKEKLGYVPVGKEDSEYCMRCFRMIHYGENKEVVTPKDIHEIINKINKDNKFVIFLTDFLNISNHTLDIFKSIKKDKLLVVNKCELLPNDVYRDNIIHFLRDTYGISNDIKLKGGTATHGAKTILKYLEEHYIKEAYILGISNSGKSTLINDLLTICDSKLTKITTNNKANTTLDFIRVKVNKNLTLIDSPGFILDDAIKSNVENKDIKSYSLNVKENETVELLNDKYFIKFNEGSPIVFYNNVNLPKPIKKVFKDVNVSNEIKIKANTDLVLLGIGFISFKKDTTIITNLDNKNIEIRQSLFGGKND